MTPAEPSIVAVEISPTISATTVVERLSAWACDMSGVVGAVPLSLLHAVTSTRATAAPASVSNDWRMLRIESFLQKSLGVSYKTLLSAGWDVYGHAVVKASRVRDQSHVF
jgi:hypothetical protein